MQKNFVGTPKLGFPKKTGFCCKTIFESQRIEEVQ